MADNESTYSSSESKENIKILVKEWFLLDKEIKSKTRRRKEIANILSPMMKRNRVDAYNLKDEGVGVVCKTRRPKQTISKKFLTSTIETYFKDNEDMAKDVTEHILNSRETIETLFLVRNDA